MRAFWVGMTLAAAVFVSSCANGDEVDDGGASLPPIVLSRSHVLDQTENIFYDFARDQAVAACEGTPDRLVTQYSEQPPYTHLLPPVSDSIGALTELVEVPRDPWIVSYTCAAFIEATTAG